MVNDFVIKYVYDNNDKYLIASLKTMYTLTEDWTGDLYCGIAPDWDYVNRIVDNSMPEYTKNKIK
jgi:hypothetical protein